MVFERKPSDYNLKKHFYNTVWQNSERETVARNILLILSKDGNDFKPFSLDYYAEHCGHNVTRMEEGYIEDLCNEGYLDLKDGEYSVNLRFIGVIETFRKKKTKAKTKRKGKVKKK